MQGRGEERFFGKGANPITGSGAALVSSHFNWLSLSAPFCRSFLLFSSSSTHHGRHSVASLPNLLVSLGSIKEVELYMRTVGKTPCHPLAVSCLNA